MNCRPSGSESRRIADRPRALTVTTVHQAKGREWDVVIVGSLDYCNPDGDPVGRELQRHCLRPSFEPADRIADFDHARQLYVAFSRPKGLLVLTSGELVHPRLAGAWDCLPRWDSMDRRATGPATVPAAWANLRTGTVSVPGACHSISQAPRRVDGPYPIAGERSATGESEGGSFVTNRPMSIRAGTSLSPQPHHREVNNTMHTSTDLHAKTRGPPRRNRVMRPLSTCCHAGRAGCIREPAWADLCPETDPLRRGPCCGGLTLERSQVGPLSVSEPPARLATPNLKRGNRQNEGREERQ